MPSDLKFIKTAIPDLIIIERNVIKDNRGFFFRLFANDELNSIGFKKPIAHINFSHTKEKFTTRGLHFQYPPNSEIKIVTCVKGEIFDLAVDLRKKSPTFLHWFGTVLSPENNRSLYIPEGFAHGFQSLKDDSELIYLHSDIYVKGSEGGLNILDPKLKIQLPNAPLNLSDRDKSFALINNDFKGINIL